MLIPCFHRKPIMENASDLLALNLNCPSSSNLRGKKTMEMQWNSHPYEVQYTFSISKQFHSLVLNILHNCLLRYVSFLIRIWNQWSTWFLELFFSYLKVKKLWTVASLQRTLQWRIQMSFFAFSPFPRIEKIHLIFPPRKKQYNSFTFTSNSFKNPLANHQKGKKRKSI